MRSCLLFGMWIFAIAMKSHSASVHSNWVWENLVIWFLWLHLYVVDKIILKLIILLMYDRQFSVSL